MAQIGPDDGIQYDGFGIGNDALLVKEILFRIASGLPVYGIAPPPQLLIHGIDDKIVNYNKMALGRWGLFGSKSLVDKVFTKQGFTYSIYRYVGHTHDMAANFVPTWDLQKRFLEHCVIGGEAVVIDATVDDPAMPLWKDFSLGDLYK